ncbi:hypothetical protein P171DRAFT_485072 [Karstenula rhodostoma CBS 690.94]|uniref:Uncharacterized protein n=1 Tax=Karstenula rhodostoma CBS 690.94 TaxID=1392251 RepID=A0A9P4UD41_9PLEO|nr:hypothetical protein P171DRAFT_485072 [Karstenula rhodostoma CBS 690.94]
MQLFVTLPTQPLPTFPVLSLLLIPIPILILPTFALPAPSNPLPINTTTTINAYVENNCAFPIRALQSWCNGAGGTAHIAPRTGVWVIWA